MSLTLEDRNSVMTRPTQFEMKRFFGILGIHVSRKGGGRGVPKKSPKDISWEKIDL